MNQLNYHYLLMAQKDLLENQSLEEILRERNTYYFSRKKHRDFWLSISPKFIYNKNVFNSLKLSKFYEQKQSIIFSSLIKSSNEHTFFGAIISLDKEFINWISLRLGYFENIDNNNFIEEKKNKNFVSDGIRGSLIISDKNININPLKNYSNYVYPDILLNKNAKFLELYYKTFTKNELELV